MKIGLCETWRRARPESGARQPTKKAEFRECGRWVALQSHPIGATGGSQVRTIVLQLRGEAGNMQVKDPQIGLVHNIGGVGLYGNVLIFGR